MNRIIPLFLPLFLFTLAACNAEPEYDETTEDALEEQVGPIEEEVMQETNYFGTWDADADTRLSRDEWGTGVGTGTWWNDWDTDRDTYLSQDEFNTAYADRPWYSEGLFGTWDTDADTRLTRDEWETGLFDTWDADRDSYLTEQEYDADLF